MAIVFNPFTGGFVVVPNPTFPGTLVISNGKTLTINNTLTFAGTDGTTMTFPTTSATVARTDAGNTFTGVSTGTSWNLTTPTITTSWVFANGQGLYDGGADVIRQYRGTNAQKLELYETRTDASNYSRLSISAPSGGPITFASEAAGTGTARGFTFTGGNFTFGSAVNVILTTTSTLALGVGGVVKSQYWSDVANTKGYFDTATTGFNWLSENRVTTNVNLAVRAVTSQSADLTQWLAAGGTTVLASVSVDGLVRGIGYDLGTDLFIRRASAAVMQYGVDVNGAAPAQTLQAANAIAGSNLAGGNLTLRPGAGTGTGTISALIFQSPTLGSTGTTAQAQTTRASMSEAGVKCFSPLWISNAAVTGLVAGAVAALTTATIVIYDSTGQAYRVPCVI